MTPARISLENPVFDMEGANNAYLLDADEVALVDTGVAADGTRAALERGLADSGYDLADVDRVFLTHWHPDHAGLTSAVQAASGATVHVHEADAPLVAGEREAFEALGGSRETALGDWGIPADTLAEFEARRGDDSGPRGYGAGDPPAVEPFVDGARFDLGGIELEAVHTPGHTAGETCYILDDGDREVFTGDALLPDYTANVGGADPRTEHALSVHLESLAALAAAEYDWGWPGHGEPMPDPTARARTVLAHHRDRAGKLLALLGDPTTVWEAARSLFGDLGEEHLMLGLGETHAHLEHLRREGLVERADDRYVAVAAASALDAAFPEVCA